MKAPSNIVKDVTAQLKAVRKKKGLSHEKVAKMARLHRSTISLIESGKRQPTLLTCLKIARALDLKLGKIITKIEG